MLQALTPSDASTCDVVTDLLISIAPTLEPGFHFEDAIGQAEAMDARPFLVQAQEAYGAMLERFGQKERAQELLAAAAAGAESLGMKVVAERAKRPQA